MERSQRIPIIAGIIGFIADIIGIATFLGAVQSTGEPVGRAVPIVILVIIFYSWFILAWASSRIAILREIQRRARTAIFPTQRTNYRLASSIAIGILASPIVLLTTIQLDPASGLIWGIISLVVVGFVIFLLLCMLMPLVHDESAYKPFG